jgi:hypothetical protein
MTVGVATATDKTYPDLGHINFPSAVNECCPPLEYIAASALPQGGK